MRNELHTPDEWCRIKGIRILDPDGWRGNIYGQSWDLPLDEAEFEARARISTQGPWDWDQQ